MPWCPGSGRSVGTGGLSGSNLCGARSAVMEQPPLGKMHFKRMDQGTDEDFQVLKRVHERTLQELPDRLFGLLADLGNDTAYNITRRDHCLQAATRALR